MVEFIDKFKEQLLSKISKEEPLEEKALDNSIALGVLLWVVAEADKKFKPEELDKIKETLTSHAKVSQEEIPVVLETIKQAAQERIDIWSFTHLFTKIPDPEKTAIIENLFRVACSDKDLDFDEIETIRRMAGLMKVSHSAFIDAKIKIKKEFGLETVN
ncbi:TerB family tellurite resistance protein [Candidatus Omnitrophota bacterium]